MSEEARAHEVAIDYGAFHGEAEIAAMLAFAAEQTAALRALMGRYLDWIEDQHEADHAPDYVAEGCDVCQFLVTLESRHGALLADGPHGRQEGAGCRPSLGAS